MQSIKWGGIKYHFWVFGMTRPGTGPRSPGSLANTLPTWEDRERKSERERKNGRIKNDKINNNTSLKLFAFLLFFICFALCYLSGKFFCEEFFFLLNSKYFLLYTLKEGTKTELVTLSIYSLRKIIENGVFGSLSTTMCQYIYIYIGCSKWSKLLREKWAKLDSFCNCRYLALSSPFERNLFCMSCVLQISYNYCGLRFD